MRSFALVLLCLTATTAVYRHLLPNRFWVVRLREGLSDVDAAQLAQVTGYKLYRKVTGFPNIFVFESALGSGRGLKRSETTVKDLHENSDVMWAAQQKKLTRDKRSIWKYFDIMDNSVMLDEDYYQPPDQEFNDELWQNEWYLKDTRNQPGLPKLDLNVLPVYERGITGRGVRVAVLDDGVEYTHDDLAANFDPEISWDCNHDSPDPRPNFQDLVNSHGTRCAGEIAMVANNHKCGVGVAFGARIGGIKLLGGHVYDLIEGMALGFAYDKVDIYSSSWGPTDDGKTVERPGLLAREAIARGVRRGRGGKGVIYVWASGNGGRKSDNCNCDGYAGSIYTITVGSASQHGTKPWYGEICSSILTVTYSSGAYNDQMITTTDVGNKCTVKHTGTSASAPLAAGIIALGLEANPNITWRDVQHIIVNTAEYVPLQINMGWFMNGAGFLYNIRFGFGLMNADEFVKTAAQWQSVPEKSIEVIPKAHLLPRNLSTGIGMISEEFMSEGRIAYLEHVEVQMDLEYSERGVLEIFLTSPRGTEIQLLTRRRRDKSKDGFRPWTFMSVATWSENPTGLWKLNIIDTSALGIFNSGILWDCKLILHGTEEMPAILANGPRVYNNYVRRA
ncbi:neuroendocrine convertase 1-like [Phlebotomus argentipes]|uniref:neuroendocrine convertase 1-like n=1 Tax=Phlebotomus argentipes TaxID=94469 RepID=UPI002892DA1D|nr:neuroendocrine convertase 1-like [Phlebotomus argentipes]